MIQLFDPKAEYQDLKTEIDSAIAKTVSSGEFILGKNVYKLEQKIAKFVGVKYAISCASGTDALVIALGACGIKPGDEVVTSPFSFFATAEAIARIGAMPVFVDVDEQSYNIDPSEILKKISKKTTAVIPVHLYGTPAQIDEVEKIAKRYGLKIIEDGCQAFGAKFKGKSIGSFGDAGCFSFFPTKNLGAFGDGGMITTNDEKIANLAISLREHGRASSSKYENNLIGYNSRLDEIQAAVLLVKLKYLLKHNRARTRIAEYYKKEIGPFLKYQKQDPASSSAFHLFVVQSKSRNKIMDYLTARGIKTAVYYPKPLHLQKAFKYLGYKKGSMPVTEKISRELFAIPAHPYLSLKEIKYITETIVNFFKK